MDARAALRTACAYLPLAKTFGAFIPNIIIYFKKFVMEAFALTGRKADSSYTQGVTLGWELLPFQGVWGKVAQVALV